MKIPTEVLALTTAAFLFATAAWSQQNSSPPATVPYVDLQRYAGLWFEIAKIPNRFQKKCAGNTTATYSLRSDGKIDVINRCMKKNGDFTEAKGIARVEDPASNAKLKVSFVRLLGVSLFWGNYWIIGLGDDYEYALIGTPDRKYGWILSRTPKLDAGKLQLITEELSKQGYDAKDFEMTRQ